MIRSTLVCAPLAALLLAACGDDGHNHDDADATSVDAASVPIDAPPPPIDGAPEFVAPTPFPATLSPTGPDQLMSAVAGPNNTFYVAGFAAATPTGPRLITVAKLTTTGLDLTFGGNDGIATTTLEFKGGSDEIDLAVQADGKILVSATVANATNPLDNDIAIARLEANGSPDLGFDTDGVVVLDLNTAHNNGTALVGRDGVRGLALGPNATIYVHGYQRGEGNAMIGGPRVDTDYALLRLTSTGAYDTTFGGGDGKHLLDIQESNATARGLYVLPTGAVIAGGYANSSGVGSTQPVLYRLTSAGVLDTNFATGGLFHMAVLAVQTEVYGFAVHGNSLVTGGYGRSTGTQNDWVTMRFDATTGARDTTWGGVAGGAPLFDVSGAMLGDNCRGAYPLPGGKTLLIGSTGSGVPDQDAGFAVLTATGTLDTTYGDGIHTFTLGAGGAEQFWGAAVSATHAVILGHKGVGATQTEALNDDSFGVVLPLR